MRIIALFTLLSFFSQQVFAATSYLDEFVAKAEQSLSQTKLLEARFDQMVSMPFIDIPLRSSGKFCFNISDKNNPMIFWEYQQPDVSGFLYKDGKAEFWTGSKSHILSESEMGYLKSMTDQILQWINFDPATLKKIYTITKGEKPMSLRFEPNVKSRLFSAIELVLSTDMRSLDELAFYGKKGEVTTITFNVQTKNKPLSSECKH